MLPKTNKKLIYLIVILPILLLLFIYLNWLWPLQNNVAQLKVEVKQERNQLDSIKTNITVDEIGKEDRTTNSNLLPTMPSIDQLVLLFKEAELRSNSKIESIEAVKQENIIEQKVDKGLTKGVVVISYHLVVSAKDYTGLTTFIQTIEEADRIIMVNNSNISSETGFNMTSGNVRAEITLETYYYPVK